MKTFGSTEESIQRVDVVNLSISAENVDDVQLSAFVVPLICDPLQGQSFPWTSLTYVYLSGLKLADYCTGDDDVMFDILIGSDQYWHLVSGRVVQGEEWSNSNGHNTCMCSFTTFTWSNANEHQRTNPVTTPVLKTTVNLGGIRPRSMYEKFEEMITFENKRYEIHLTWKVPHPPLPDLSVKRLNNLLKRRKKDSEVLKEYDSVSKEQLRKGILKS